MEKIPTNPTCRDNKQVCEGRTGGPPTLKIPPIAEERRGKGKKKKREGREKGTKSSWCSNTELWRGIGETGTSPLLHMEEQEVHEEG